MNHTHSVIPNLNSGLVPVDPGLINSFRYSYTKGSEKNLGLYICLCQNSQPKLGLDFGKLLNRQFGKGTEVPECQSMLRSRSSLLGKRIFIFKYLFDIEFLAKISRWIGSITSRFSCLPGGVLSTGCQLSVKINLIKCKFMTGTN